MAGALRFGVGGRPVDPVHGAEPDPAQRPREVCAVAALVVGAQAEVLVELEQGRLLRMEAAVRGVSAQHRVHVDRRVAGGQDQAQARPGPQAVRDQFAAEQRDAHRMAQDQRVGRDFRHGGQL